MRPRRAWRCSSSSTPRPAGSRLPPAAPGPLRSSAGAPAPPQVCLRRPWCSKGLPQGQKLNQQSGIHCLLEHAMQGLPAAAAVPALVAVADGQGLTADAQQQWQKPQERLQQMSGTKVYKLISEH